MKRTAIFLSALILVSVLTGCDHTPKISMKEDIEAEYGFDLDYSTLFDKDESDDNIIVKEIKDYDKNKLVIKKSPLSFPIKRITSSNKK